MSGEVDFPVELTRSFRDLNGMRHWALLPEAQPG